jgi:uncharacterized protein YndB with AHSA1/START domain
MAATPETGYLLIADLTGYTAYLSQSELEHAPTIAGDLLETVIGRLEPPFRLAKLEGDAACFYVEDGRAEGSLLLDAIEAAYLAFRRRLRSIDQATACDCNSCRLAPQLNLKLFLHHGSYVHGRIAGRDELAGPDVILVHRLLKGGTAQAAHDERGAAPGFAVLTEHALAALGIRPGDLDLEPGHETVEHVGEVGTSVLDLERRWEAEQGRRRVSIEPDGALLDHAATVAAPPAEVWAHLTVPGLRALWEGSIELIGGPAGAVQGVGTINRCVTGRLATLEEIVDWQPYEHISYRVTVPGLGPVEATIDLEPEGQATVVRMRWAKPGGFDVDAEIVARVVTARGAALRQLARLLDGRLPMATQLEVRA